MDIRVLVRGGSERKTCSIIVEDHTHSSLCTFGHFHDFPIVARPGQVRVDEHGTECIEHCFGLSMENPRPESLNHQSYAFPTGVQATGAYFLRAPRLGT